MDRLTAMEVFVRVVETGSFSKAARLLRVGQPAVSKTIAHLAKSASAAEETVTLKGSVRTTAAEGLREAVFAGLGLCVASEWMFQPDLDSGRVKPVLPAWILPPLDLWAAFPTGHRASAKARAFAAFVEDQLRRPISRGNPPVARAISRPT